MRHCIHWDVHWPPGTAIRTLVSAWTATTKRIDSTLTAHLKYYKQEGILLQTHIISGGDPDSMGCFMR